MDDLPLDGKRVIVRVDFNVSVGSDGVVDEWEDYRIKAALPTIQELQQRRCRVALLTHRGRSVEGQEAVDLAPIHRRLEELLKEDVRQLKHLHGDEVEATLTGMSPGEAALLPNIRLDEREILANERLADELSAAFDIYINEAFSVSHRAHTSVAVLPRKLPSAAGRRTVIEVENLRKLQANPERPFVAIASGAKISTKVGMLRRLSTTVDMLCLGGVISNVFLAATGRIPEERYSADEVAAAKSLLADVGKKIILPVDVVVGPKNGLAAFVKTIPVEKITADVENIWDVGEKTIKKFLDVCHRAHTIMWNGPMGKFEIPAYGKGTLMLAKGLADLSAYRVVGGGDTVNAIEQAHLGSKFNHLSVGGGAMIAFLEGKRMPGLEPLYDNGQD